MATLATQRIDVAEFIDAQPLGRFQIGVLVACSAVLFLDGYDTQAVGYVAPAITGEWHLARGALGPAFSAGLFGLMLGALVLSPVADRFGRKRVILASTIWFGLGVIATAFARDLPALLLIRFVTGLGLGGAMPNAVALSAEFSPLRRRAALVMAMFTGFSVGAALGGGLAALLIPAFGWRAVFVVGGVLPLLLVPVLLRAIPESPRFLALRGGADAAIGALLRRLAPGSAPAADARFTAQEERHGFSVAALFRDGRAAMTLLLWLVFFMSLLDIYLLANWLPTVLHELGASIPLAAAIGALFQVGGVAGAFALGRAIDRFGFAAQAAIYLLAALAVAAIGLSARSVPLAAITIFLGGFFVIGGQTASNALSATSYPTAMRATGIGWALGIGRIGSIVGPAVGGIALAHDLAPDALFIAAALPALIAAAASVALARVRR